MNVVEFGIRLLGVFVVGDYGLVGYLGVVDMYDDLFVYVVEFGEVVVVEVESFGVVGVGY